MKNMTISLKNLNFYLGSFVLKVRGSSMKNRIILGILIILIVFILLFILLFDRYLDNINNLSNTINKDIKVIQKENDVASRKLKILKDKNDIESKNLENMNQYINSLNERVKNYE